MSGTNARGQWGEANLERLVEAAGMIERVHFDTQATLVGMDSAKRPDMIVNLPGGRSIVVDAKVPLNALLAETDVDAYSAVTLQRHAAALKEHIGILAGRDYAQLLPDTPELVVLYLPAESLLSLAVAADAGVLDYAFGKGVALATPNTMLALLRTVNHGISRRSASAWVGRWRPTTKRWAPTRRGSWCRRGNSPNLMWSATNCQRRSPSRRVRARSPPALSTSPTNARSAQSSGARRPPEGGSYSSTDAAAAFISLRRLGGRAKRTRSSAASTTSTSP